MADQMSENKTQKSVRFSSPISSCVVFDGYLSQSTQSTQEATESMLYENLEEEPLYQESVYYKNLLNKPHYFKISSEDSCNLETDNASKNGTCFNLFESEPVLCNVNYLPFTDIVPLCQNDGDSQESTLAVHSSQDINDLDETEETMHSFIGTILEKVFKELNENMTNLVIESPIENITIPKATSGIEHIITNESRVNKMLDQKVLDECNNLFTASTELTSYINIDLNNAESETEKALIIHSGHKHFQGLYNASNEIDYYSAVPFNDNAQDHMVLHLSKKHKILLGDEINAKKRCYGITHNCENENLENKHLMLCCVEPTVQSVTQKYDYKPSAGSLTALKNPSSFQPYKPDGETVNSNFSGTSVDYISDSTFNQECSSKKRKYFIDPPPNKAEKYARSDCWSPDFCKALQNRRELPVEQDISRKQDDHESTLIPDTTLYNNVQKVELLQEKSSTDNNKVMVNKNLNGNSFFPFKIPIQVLQQFKEKYDSIADSIKPIPESSDELEIGEKRSKCYSDCANNDETKLDGTVDDIRAIEIKQENQRISLMDDNILVISDILTNVESSSNCSQEQISVSNAAYTDVNIPKRNNLEENACMQGDIEGSVYIHKEFFFHDENIEERQCLARGNEQRVPQDLEDMENYSSTDKMVGLLEEEMLYEGDSIQKSNSVDAEMSSSAEESSFSFPPEQKINRNLLFKHSSFYSGLLFCIDTNICKVLNKTKKRDESVNEQNNK